MKWSTCYDLAVTRSQPTVEHLWRGFITFILRNIEAVLMVALHAGLLSNLKTVCGLKKTCKQLHLLWQLWLPVYLTLKKALKNQILFPSTSLFINRRHLKPHGPATGRSCVKPVFPVCSPLALVRRVAEEGIKCAPVILVQEEQWIFPSLGLNCWVTGAQWGTSGGVMITGLHP